MVRWPRSGSSRAVALCVGCELPEGRGDRREHVAHHQQDAGQRALHAARGVAAVAVPSRMVRRRLVQRRSAQQRGDVVGQHLGRHIDDQRLLAESRDGLEVQAMLQALERFLDTPALVVQIAEGGSGDLLGAEVGGQHPDGAARRDMANQPHRRGHASTAPVLRVACRGHVEPHRRLGSCAAHELAHRRPTAVVVAAHDEADAALLQRLHQPGGRVAAVQQQTRRRHRACPATL